MKKHHSVEMNTGKFVFFFIFSLIVSTHLFAVEHFVRYNYAVLDKTSVKPHFSVTTQDENSSKVESNPLVVNEPPINVTNKVDDATRKAAEEQIKNLPITFRKNMGQSDDKILYSAQSPSWSSHVSFLKDKLSFGFSREKYKEDPADKNKKIGYFELLVWNMDFVGANPSVEVIGKGKEDSKSNYFIGKDQKRWAQNVPDFRMLTYKNIYTGIDLNYYSTGKELKYDYVLNAGADVTQIKLKLEGVKHVSVNKQGQLEIETAWGSLLEEIPESYQLINGEKRRVKVEYKLFDKNTYGYVIKGKYDHQVSLVIDPINLSWATFVGGSTNGDIGYLSDIAVDASGSLYATGQVGLNYPTTVGVYDTSFNGTTAGYGDVYVTKLTPNASAIVYSTYIGGSGIDRGFSIAVNAANEAFVCGTTYSADFPVTGGVYQNFFGGFRDVLSFGLTATGNALLFSTYIGGAYQDEGLGLALDAASNNYITGYSQGTGFPTTGGVFDTSNPGMDAFITVVNTTGNIVFSTYVAGNDAQTASTKGRDICISSTGDIFITGNTYGLEASPGAYQTTFGGGCCSSDGFVAKFNATGTARAYCTYIGGTADDQPYAITTNASGEAYITGYSSTFTGNSDWPTTVGAYNTTLSPYQGFVTKFNSTGTALVFSTYIENACTGYDISLDSNDEIFVAGDTGNMSGPVTACSYQSVNNGAPDYFIAKFNANASSLLYYSYLGGCMSEYANGVEIGFGDIGMVLWGPCKDEVFIGGSTHSMNTSSGLCPVPVTTTAGSYQPTRAGGGDMPYIIKFKPEVTPDFTTSNPACGTTVDFTDNTNGSCIWGNTAWAPTNWTWDFGDGNTSTLQSPTHTYASPGNYNVKLVISCPKDSITKNITVGSPPFTVTTSTVSATCTAGGSATATPSIAGSYTYSWSNAATGQTATNLNAATYTVTVTNSATCTVTTTATVVQTGATFTVSATSTPGSCTTGGTATATPSAIGTYTYAWSNAATGQTATNLSAATYSVTVTNSAGCTSSSTVAVIQTGVTFTVTASSSPVGCSGSGTAFASPTPAGSYTYVWSNAATGQTISGLSAATYTVTTTDGGGCTSIQTATVGTSTVTVTAATSSTQASCGGTNGSANVTISTGTAPYTYLWSSGGATGATLSNVSAGNYSVTITDAAGCTLVSPVAVSNSTTLASTPSATPGCPETGGSIFAGTPSGGTSPYTYLWSSAASGATGATVSGLSSGSYDLTITDASSCVILKTVTLANLSSPAASAGPDATITSGSSTTLTASGGTNYLWSPPTGLSSTVVSNPIASPTSTTIYTVTVTDANNCSATDYVIVSVEIKCNGTTDVVFIPNAFSPNGEGAIPNEKLRVHAGNCVKSFIFIVYDRWGRKVFEATTTADEWDGTINGAEAQSGVYAYVIQVTTTTDEVTEKKGNITLLR